MIIVSKDEGCILPFGHIERIYVRDNNIMVTLLGKMSTKLGFYESNTDAKIALRLLSKKIATGAECVRTPTDKEVKAEIVNQGYFKQRSMTGKKVKGHGGS